MFLHFTTVSDSQIRIAVYSIVSKAAALGNHPANVATAVEPAAKSIKSFPVFESMLSSMLLGFSFVIQESKLLK